MVSQTKNILAKDAVAEMTKKIFPSDGFAYCRELTEGFFNAAYEVTLQSGNTVILKIAPEKDKIVMTYERGIMSAEVGAMQAVQSVDGIPAPAVIGFDDSCTVCSAPYFFMQKISGDSLNSVKLSLSKTQLSAIYVRTGEIAEKVNAVECPVFGYPAQKAFQGAVWFEVFEKMLRAAVSDAEKMYVDLKIPTEKLFRKFAEDRAVFDEVTSPRLVHWDIWDGNIFVKDGEVTGIIDWERAVWGDPLMEVGFRTYNINVDFMKGYGIKKLSKTQMRRAVWYDIYALCLMAAEGAYRQYETQDFYEWAVKLLKKTYKKL